MNVGILTYHWAINPGAVVQAYCVQELLREDGRFDVEVMDYRPMAAELRAWRRVISRRPVDGQLTSVPRFDVGYWRKLQGIRDFVKTHLALGKARAARRAIKGGGFARDCPYDAIVVGSDTVLEVTDMADPPVAPNPYYLPDACTNKFAFAASADGSVPELYREPARRAALRSCLNNFEFIGYRDATTEDLLEELKVNLPERCFMPDPTLIRGVEDLVDHANLSQQVLNRKTAAVAIGNYGLAVQVAQTLQKDGWLVINLLGAELPGEVPWTRLFSIGSFLAAHAEVSLVVTDRFHSSLFTIQLGPGAVIFVDRPDRRSGRSSKGMDLFDRLGVPEMVWDPAGEGLEPDVIHRRLWAWENHGRKTVVRNLGHLRDEGNRALGALRASLANADSRYAERNGQP